jgi:tRNA-dihydrouridine synthase
MLGDVKNFSIMKKHFKAYVTGFEGAKELRIRLMDEATNSSDVRKIVDIFLTNI